MSEHFLEIGDLGKTDIYALMEQALKLKKGRDLLRVLANKCMVLVFEKASTRTRISFEVAVAELGGYSIFMTPSESQLGRKEPIKDTARVLSRYAHGIIVRTFAQENLKEFADYAEVPVINALTDKFHPCQVMSDLLTIYERTPDFSNLKVAWIGDGNNMANSWVNAARFLPFSLHLACPEGYAPDEEVVARSKASGAKIDLCQDPIQAVKGADYICTDVWASMGEEDEAKSRKEHFERFQVNRELLESASFRTKVMHCLPAHRGEEISEEVLESKNSIVWDQAENRLHMQKAILLSLYSKTQ